MDAWLTDSVKTLFFKPCLEIAERIGRRLDNRTRMHQSIDERALTEDLVDAFDTRSNENAWGTVLSSLQDHQIYVSTRITKSTREYETGADIGLVMNRQIYQTDNQAKARYACLIQCKRVDEDGYVSDFFHQVRSSGKYQSALMLDITPNSFYFIFIPPSLLKTYHMVEPIAFLSASPGCSSPVWNMGYFEYDSDHVVPPFLSTNQKQAVSSILVVPALAVESQVNKKQRASIIELLPNCLPLWYWFGELLIPGFIGDYRSQVVSVATNVRGANREILDEFSVNYSIDISFGSG